MKTKQYINVGESVQEAVESVSAQGGGSVTLQAGEHVLRNALRLRSGVSIAGEDGAVLTRLPSIQTGLSRYIGYGHYEVPLQSAEGFEVGDGIHIEDDASVGFYNTVATVVEKCGDTLYIDRFLNHDYNPELNAKVTRVFSVVEGVGVDNCNLENITLDGNPEETFLINGCRAGAVFFLMTRNMSLDNVEIRNFRGDGLSYQQSVDVFVRNCNIHSNAGGGLHPGSGSVRYIIEGNHVHDNNGCGLFYCLRTTNSLCANNRFENNKGQGISVGERDTDHIIRNNRILSNNKQGVLFREVVREGGNRVLLESNVIGSNCRVEGAYEIEVSDNVEDIFILNNSIIPVKAAPVSVGDKGGPFYVFGNTVSGQPQTNSDIHGDSARKMLKNPQLPPLGPEAVTSGSTRHLNIGDITGQ